jgi:predicted dehydrogenase
MVLSSGDLDQILQAREMAGTEICVIHNLKYSPGVQQARKWVTEGRIGSIVSLERQFLTDPVTDRMLRAENHWSHGLPGGRWVETLPHELYLIHDFLGPLEVEHVQTLHVPGTPHPHTADEMMVALRGDDTIATLRYSARCRSNHRTLTIHGTNGSIRVELLSSSAVLYEPRTRKWVRGAGLDALNAFSAMADMIPDRLRAIGLRIRKETPHSRLIHDYARCLLGRGKAPVSLDEISYVVRTGELIGQLAASPSHVVA